MWKGKCRHNIGLSYAPVFELHIFLLLLPSDVNNSRSRFGHDGRKAKSQVSCLPSFLDKTNTILCSYLFLLVISVALVVYEKLLVLKNETFLVK